MDQTGQENAITINHLFDSDTLIGQVFPDSKHWCRSPACAFSLAMAIMSVVSNKAERADCAE